LLDERYHNTRSERAHCPLPYYFAVNVACFGLFAWDKQSAQLGRRRTPERTLLTLAFIGGTIGAVVAQQALRHKTMKEPFRTRLGLIVVSQAVICGAAMGLALWEIFWGGAPT
jgi:uncharacterized membrane protein YsdA (DUF1294 family)